MFPSLHYCYVHVFKRTVRNVQMNIQSSGSAIGRRADWRSESGLAETQDAKAEDTASQGAMLVFRPYLFSRAAKHLTPNIKCASKTELCYDPRRNEGNQDFPRLVML